jgi:bacteriorhodopsin
MDWKSDTYNHKHKHVPDTEYGIVRQILWLRYVNWFLTGPLILASLTLLSGLPGASLFAAIVADWVMLGTGLFGTYAPNTSRKWIWFALSAIAFITLIYHIGVKGTRAANNRDSHTRRLFSAIATVALLAKALYPMYVLLDFLDYPILTQSSTLAAGPLSLKLGLTGETILFAIHDIIIQGILGYWLVIANDAATGT